MRMQKQKAQPNIQKSPYVSFSDETFLQIQNLNLNDRSVSIADTNDDGLQKQACSLFDIDFFKRKGIQKRQVKKQSVYGKKKHNYQRKVQLLQQKLQKLQKELSSLRRKQVECPLCLYNFQSDQRSIKDYQIRQLITQDFTYTDVAGSCQRNCPNETVQFQKINFMTPLMTTQEMEEKLWIFIGTMMIAMGSKVMDIDGTLNVFKVLKESVDSIRRQVEKCQEKINLQFYTTKENFADGCPHSQGMNFDPFFAKNQEHPAGFQLQGVKLQSVEQYELFYDKKFEFSVKYEALITVMQYLRDQCAIS